MNKETEDTGIAGLVEVANVVAGAQTDPMEHYHLHDGRLVHVFKCRPRNVGTVLAFVADILRQLGVQAGGKIEVDFTNPQALLRLVAGSVDQALVVASELCSLTYEELNDIDLDEAIEILRRVVAVNQKFFTESVWPAVQSALPQNQAAERTATPRTSDTPL